MSTTTPNLGLTKPAGSDLIDISVLNGNFDILDGSGILVFQTLTDLQTAFPNGYNRPVWVVADNDWYYWTGAVAINVSSVVATSTLTAIAPIISVPGNVNISSVLATMNAQAIAPIITIPGNITVSALAATVTTQALNPTLSIPSSINVSAVSAQSTTSANAPTVTATTTAAVTYLSMNGTSDYLKTPSLTFDEIDVDWYPMQNATTWDTYLDARTGVVNSYIQNDAANSDSYNASVWTSISINGGANQTSLNSNLIPRNTRSTAKFKLSTAGTDDVVFFTKYTIAEFMKGNLYDIKFYNAGVLVAHYDMSTGTVQDQSGNGKHATLTGGTFVTG